MRTKKLCTKVDLVFIKAQAFVGYCALSQVQWIFISFNNQY